MTSCNDNGTREKTNSGIWREEGVKQSRNSLRTTGQREGGLWIWIRDWARVKGEMGERIQRFK